MSYAEKARMLALELDGKGEVNGADITETMQRMGMAHSRPVVSKTLKIAVDAGLACRVSPGVYVFSSRSNKKIKHRRSQKSDRIFIWNQKNEDYKNRCMLAVLLLAERHLSINGKSGAEARTLLAEALGIGASYLRESSVECRGKYYRLEGKSAWPAAKHPELTASGIDKLNELVIQYGLEALRASMLATVV